MSIWTEFKKMGIMPSVETEDLIKSCFQEYIMYEPIGRKGERLWKHTACGAYQGGHLDGKAGETITCPECGERAKLVASNRVRTGSSLTKWEKILWFKELGGELFAVAADCGLCAERETWEGPDWYTYLTYNPKQIYHWDKPGGKPEVWYYSGYLGWQWSESPREPFLGTYESHQYAVFGWDEIKKTSMRYSAVDMWNCDDTDGEFTQGVVKYLCRYQREPKLEQVIKWGLLDFAKAYIEERAMNKRLANWEAGTPWEFLRMSKAQYKEFIQYAPEGGLQLLKDNRRLYKLQPENLARLCKRIPRAYQSWGDVAVDIVTAYGLQLQDVVKYLEKVGARQAITWRDYMNLAKQCGWDMTAHNVRFPKDLQQAHDNMVEIRRAMRKEEELAALREQDKKYQERYQQLYDKYSYQSGELRIVIPKGAADLVEEGNTLHICVGGYAQRHLDGKCDIVFLRHARRPERSYICIEVRDNRIIQVHGYRNEAYKTKSGRRPVAPAVKYQVFINEWMAWVKAGSKRNNQKGRIRA